MNIFSVLIGTLPSVAYMYVRIHSTMHIYLLLYTPTHTHHPLTHAHTHTHTTPSHTHTHYPPHTHHPPTHTHTAELGIHGLVDQAMSRGDEQPIAAVQCGLSKPGSGYSYQSSRECMLQLCVYCTIFCEHQTFAILQIFERFARIESQIPLLV